MKRWLLLFLCLLLTACGSEAAEQTLPAVTEAIPVTAPTEQPQSPAVLSHEMAMLEGYVVMDEGDVRHNAGNWVAFLKECEAGNSANVKVAAFELGDAGYTYVIYDLSYDEEAYHVTCWEDGAAAEAAASVLVRESGKLDDGMEPYDSYVRYRLGGLAVYQDLIAEPDFEGVGEIFLHDKEGEPPVRTYTAEEMQPVLDLLWNAEYVAAEPENYLYGMKLLMTNRDGQELVIELDLKQGYYRYGMQNYRYGEVTDLLAALGLQQWPDSVLEEYKDFLD